MASFLRVTSKKYFGLVAFLLCFALVSSEIGNLRSGRQLTALSQFSDPASIVMKNTAVDAVGNPFQATIVTVKPQPKVFLFGYVSVVLPLARLVFPEYQPITFEGQKASPDDVLLIGMTGHPFSFDDFPGKILNVNGEFSGDEMPGTFILGPKDDSPNSIRVPYATVALLEMSVERQRVFHDVSTPRPRNTGKNFLAYISSRCFDFRDEAFGRLSALQPVHFGGKCPKDHEKDNMIAFEAKGIWTNLPEVYSDFRFALVMENHNVPGYHTEKIINPFLGGSIPIYSGSDYVFEIFNKDAFVYYDVANPQPALDLVAYLEANETAYNEMLAQPILADGARTVERFFSFGDDIGGGVLKGRIRRMLGIDG